MGSAPTSGRILFGPFVLDPESGELTKRGRKIRLSEQAFQILVLLANRPGRIVTREEIRQRLWPNGTLVEFDHSINTAVKKLRVALGDSAEVPRYIETVARRGYRLVAPADRAKPAPAPDSRPVEISSPAGDLTGRRISHYRILNILGGGAMGLVYRAEDLKLGRQVALKFLPAELTRELSAIERLRREACAASALSHPNICTVHAIEEEAGHPFIVMELLEGHTLRERIAQAALSIEETIDFGIEIVDALYCAHQHGIIHRDIKPANIFVTDRGQAKILDFGVAKLTKYAGGIEGTEAAAMAASFGGTTVTRVDLTRTGVRMGTAAYMSPEQIRGESVDSRTDLFSFGLVLYEMATGRQAFEQQTMSLLHDAILHRPPVPVRHVNPQTPVELVKIIDKAVQKDRASRYQTASQIGDDLIRLRDREPRRWRARPSAKRSSRRPLAMLGSIFALITLGWAAFLYRRHPDSSDDSIVATTFTTYPGQESQPEFSPDGKQIAFVWNGPERDNFDIYVKSIGSAEVRRLTTHPGFHFDPAWSRDGRFIAFRRLDKGRCGVYIIPAAGGVERKLTETVRPPGFGVAARDCKPGMSWSRDGRQLLMVDAARSNGGFSAIISVSTVTGEKRILTSPSEGWGDLFPVLASDDRSFAFVRGREERGVSRIYIQSLDPAMNPKGEPRLVSDDGNSKQGLAWTPSGNSLVFASRAQCWVVPKTGGTAHRLGGVCQSPSTLTVAVKQNRLAYTRAPHADENIYRLPLPVPKGLGNPATLFISSPEVDYSAEFSPDGKKVALVSARSNHLEIWVCSAAGSDCRQITSAGGPEVGSPKWSPDERRIAFDFDQHGHYEIYTVNADGRAPQRLTTAPSHQVRPNWSADGRWIYFGSDRQDGWQIWKMRSEGGVATRVTRQGGIEAAESRDGQFVYYDKRGTSGIWRIPASGGEETRVTEIGEEGQWTLTRDGIYILTRKPALGFLLQRYSFTTHRISELAKIPSNVIGLVYNELEPSLSVSPDRHSILFAQMDHADTEIVLVQGFRE